MSFIALLLALLVERALWDGQTYRQFLWFAPYLEKFTQPLAQQWLGARLWSAMVIVGLPLLLVAWVQFSIAPAIGELAEFALALGALLLALGPRELGKDVETYLNARDKGPEQAEYAAQELAVKGESTLDQRIASGIYLGLKQRLIGPLCWFVLFGAVGAIAYRLAQLLVERTATDPRFSHLLDSSQFLAGLLDWLPTRLSAAGFAIAGNFDAVAVAWKSCGQDSPGGECPDNNALVIATGQAALDAGPSNDNKLIVEDALTLAWRNLTAWVVLLGAMYLFTYL